MDWVVIIITFGFGLFYVGWPQKAREQYLAHFDCRCPNSNLKELAYQTGLDSRVGRTHALMFDVRFDGERVRETLVFVRGEDGEMQLWKLGIEPVD